MKRNQSLFAIATGLILFISLLIWLRPQAATPENSHAPDARPQDLAAAWASGDFVTSNQIINELIELQPNNGDLLYKKGILTLFDDPSAGVTRLQQAAEIEPSYENNVNMLQNAMLVGQQNNDPGYQKLVMGQALAGIGEWPAAEFLFQQVTEMNPTYTEAWGYLGEAQQQNGKDGLTALSTAYELSPDALVPNLLLGIYWRRQSQPENALSYFEKANAIAPNTHEIQIELGQSLAQLGQVNEALDTFQAIVDNAPDKQEAWLELATYAIDHEVFVLETGLPAARQAFLMAPGIPETTLLLGRTYALLAEPLLANRFYRETLELTPENPTAHYYLGLLLIAEGARESAFSHLQQALEFSESSTLTTQIESVINEYFP